MSGEDTRQEEGKNYFKKLNNFENKIEHDPVNLSQDLSINL